MLNRQKAHRGRAEWADPDASLGLPGHRVGDLGNEIGGDLDEEGEDLKE